MDHLCPDGRRSFLKATLCFIAALYQTRSH